jgi:hypothetical protein
MWHVVTETQLAFRRAKADRTSSNFSVRALTSHQLHSHSSLELEHCNHGDFKRSGPEQKLRKDHEA